MDAYEAEVLNRKRVEAELALERREHEATSHKLRNALDGLEKHKDKIGELEDRRTLPLDEPTVEVFQKKFDALVMHAKTGLADAIDIAEAAVAGGTPDLNRLRERIKHELNWIRDNGAGLIGTVCRGGKLFSFSSSRRGTNAEQR